MKSSCKPSSSNMMSSWSVSTRLVKASSSTNLGALFKFILSCLLLFNVQNRFNLVNLNSTQLSMKNSDKSSTMHPFITNSLQFELLSSMVFSILSVKINHDKYTWKYTFFSRFGKLCCSRSILIHPERYRYFNRFGQESSTNLFTDFSSCCLILPRPLIHIFKIDFIWNLDALFYK